MLTLSSIVTVTDAVSRKTASEKKADRPMILRSQLFALCWPWRSRRRPAASPAEVLPVEESKDLRAARGREKLAA